MPRIITINLSMPFKMGFVNCYLLESDTGYLLIDTGGSNKRVELEQALEKEGCKPGNLKLIVLTHGDFDHTGNAAYLRCKYGAQIAMHRDDSAMVERGDMFVNRRQPNILIRKMLPAFSGFSKEERFKPDIPIDDGYELSRHGFEAKVLSLPGHSRGSIGILFSDGNLFCGDLFENLKKPALISMMDDLTAANASLEKLKRIKISTVYPGHGEPFAMAQFKAN